MKLTLGTAERTRRSLRSLSVVDNKNCLSYLLGLSMQKTESNNTNYIITDPNHCCDHFNILGYLFLLDFE